MKRLLLLGGGMLALSACTVSPGYGDRPTPVIVQSQAPRDHIIMQAPQQQPVIMRDAYDDLDIRLPVPRVVIGPTYRRGNYGYHYGERNRYSENHWNKGYRYGSYR